MINHHFFLKRPQDYAADKYLYSLFIHYLTDIADTRRKTEEPGRGTNGLSSCRVCFVRC